MGFEPRFLLHLRGWWSKKLSFIIRKALRQFQLDLRWFSITIIKLQLHVPWGLPRRDFSSPNWFFGLEIYLALSLSSWHVSSHRTAGLIKKPDCMSAKFYTLCQSLTAINCSFFLKIHPTFRWMKMYHKGSDDSEKISNPKK